MRILELHCDYIFFKPVKKAIAGAEELPADLKEGRRLENVLVVFTSIEEGDNEEVAKNAAGDVKRNFGEVHAKNLLVYPYAHLSSNLAKPAQAVKILNVFFEECKKHVANAEKSVFGYYKEFELKCKGHPLAELSKSFSAKKMEERVGELGAREVVVAGEKEVVSESLKQEEKVKSEFFVLTPEGKLVDANKFDYGKNKDLRDFVQYETHKTRAYAVEPAHVRIMREHALVDYEPGSDSGNLRWYPKGRLMKKIIEKKVADVCIGYGAMEVETPIMYDFEHPALKKYLNRFPARQYVVKSDEKDYFLRFSACFGQFLVTHDMNISYKDLPLKMFELTKYSFRREQSGEVAGLKRLRCFTMPDMHTLCRDLEGAKKEFEAQFNLCRKWMDELGLEFETAFRAQKEFFEENKKWYEGMVKKLGKPVLLELFDRRYAYFITKFEFNVVDTQKKGSALSTVQIDTENAETFDLNYVGEKGERQRPIILHASISGSTDRVVYALLEQQARRIQENKTPSFPVWLSPTQVRLIPISEKQDAYCEKVLAELKEKNIRADYDDRQDTIDKKIRAAEREWIPFIAVVGDKEVNEKNLSVRVRESGKNEKMKVDVLAKRVADECTGQPFEPLSLQDHLSKRPVI